MNTFTQCETSTVRLQVNPPRDCNGWSMSFDAAGWRIFHRPVYKDGSVLMWLLKRGACAFLVRQLANEKATIDIDIPSDYAEEVVRLMVASGLAVPAS